MSKLSITSPKMAQSQPTTGSGNSTPSTTTEGLGRKPPWKRDLFYKHGHKLHPYDGKAPYPLYYDRPVLELWVQLQCSHCFQISISLHRESLDTKFCQFLRNSVSFVDFEEPPDRVMDLGCGVSRGILFCTF